MVSGILVFYYVFLLVIGVIELIYNVVFCFVLFDKFLVFSLYMIMINGVEKESIKDYFVIINFMFFVVVILEGVKENIFKDFRIGIFLMVYFGNYKKRNVF